MRPRAPVALLLFLSLAGPAAMAGPYLQENYDAARTGATPDEGPERYEVAWRVLLPGRRAGEASPLLAGDHVYVAVTESPIEQHWFNGVVRVSLATAEPELIVELDEGPLGLASDGERLFVVRPGGADTYTMDGALIWSWDHPQLARPMHRSTYCLAPAVADDTFYLLCEEASRATPPGTGDFTSSVAPEVTVFAAAIDAATGAERWLWVRQPQDDETPAGLVPSRLFPDPNTVIIHGFAVIEERAYAVTRDLGRRPGGSTQVWALDEATGELLWTQAIVLGSADPVETPPVSENQRQFVLGGDPTGSADETFLALNDLMGLDPPTGQVLWRHPIPPSNRDVAGGTSLALRGNDLYVGALDTLRRFDVQSREELWTTVLGPYEHFDPSALIVAGDALYTRTHLFRTDPDDPQAAAVQNDNVLYAFDAGTGQVRFRQVIEQDPERRVNDFQTEQFSLGLGSGLLVLAGMDGSVALVGRTTASLAPVVEASTRFPAPGEEVRVNLSATRPGVHGPATEHRADWGDGTETDWQASPVLTHAYAGNRDYTASFEVRNEAGQSAVDVVTFSVGGSAPTVLERAFARDNQDLTFGVLGIAVALGGGVLALGRNRRRHGRLQRELDAIDEAAGMTRDQPRAFAMALEERRTHCRGLLLNGRLDEAQFAIIERRITELARSARTTEMRERLAFLPLGIAERLQASLEDGRISAFEREHIEMVVEADGLLTKAQKRKVLAMVDAWFAQDEGGGT